MKLRNDYTYTLFKRENDEKGVRWYYPPDSKPVPSVTTIISALKDTKTLDAWRDRIGDEEADKIVKESTVIGEHLHQNLENHILGNNKPRTGPMISKLMTDIIIKNGLKNVSEVWGTEASLYIKDLYAGTTDLIATHEGSMAIVDFKNSKKAKKDEWLEDYKLQLCAYIEAHNSMFGTNIDKGVIMMATRDCKYIEIVLDGSNLIEFKDKWYRKLEEYYTKFPRASG